MLSADWTWPTALRFGAGRLAELGEVCAAAGMTRPLLVTDATLAGLDITARALEAIEAAAIFAEVGSNPTEAQVAAGLAAFAAGGHDGIVAFGGGSPLDCGKVIGERAGAKVIAVPTTAGSGAEVRRDSVLLDDDRTLVFLPTALPVAAICDPELTIDLPPQVTAASGMDALVHCIEAYCSPHYHPMADGIAVEGIRLVKEYLPRAYRDGEDIEARAGMMSAAVLGGVACEKGLGAVHALSCPVGAVYGTHHGLTNGVLLPYVLDFNREVVFDKIERLADWLGLEDGFSGFLDFVLRMRRDLGVPHTLGRIGVGEDRFEDMARMALLDPSAGRALKRGDAVDLYQRAMDGRVG